MMRKRKCLLFFCYYKNLFYVIICCSFCSNEKHAPWNLSKFLEARNLLNEFNLNQLVNKSYFCVYHSKIVISIFSLFSNVAVQPVSKQIHKIQPELISKNYIMNKFSNKLQNLEFIDTNLMKNYCRKN